jgi:hypothetical protein
MENMHTLVQSDTKDSLQWNRKQYDQWGNKFKGEQKQTSYNGPSILVWTFTHMRFQFYWQWSIRNFHSQ